jgi:epi-isozizaene synthase
MCWIEAGHGVVDPDFPLGEIMLLDSFNVPEFSLPFANSKHPQAEQANAEATEWAVGHRLINEDAADGFAGIGFGNLAARVSHEAYYERLVTFAQWMAWSFVLDDQHDHLIRTGRLEAWHPFAQAINRSRPPGA